MSSEVTEEMAVAIAQAMKNLPGDMPGVGLVLVETVRQRDSLRAELAEAKAQRVPDGYIVVPAEAWQEAIDDYASLLPLAHLVQLKFSSGNNVPVERITIKFDEYKQAMQKFTNWEDVQAWSLASRDDDAEAAWLAESEHLNCPHCGGSGHVDDVKQSAVPDGYALVPVEPTKAMIAAGAQHTMPADEDDATGAAEAKGRAMVAWKFMLAAAKEGK